MDSSVKIAQMVMQVTGVTDVIVTTSVQDPDVGDWVRDLRIFGADGVMVLQVSIRAPGKQELEFTAPSQQY